MNTHYEKRPQYPVYRMPFKGDSLYRDSFVNNLDEQQKKAIELNRKLSAPSIDPKEIKLKLSADHLNLNCAGLKFEERNKMIDTSKLMNDNLYKSTSMKPRQEAVSNIPAPSQYDTIYRNEYIPKPLIVKKNLKQRVPIW